MSATQSAAISERRPARASLRPAHTAAAACLAVAAAAATIMRLTPSAWGAAAAGAAAILVWVAAIDLETRLLPDRIVLPATALLLVAGAVLEPDRAPERLVAAIAASGSLVVAVLVRPGSLGMGDAKLALLLGALLGRGVLAALAVGFSAVGVVGLVLLAIRGRSALQARLPLAPFLTFGALLVLLVHG